MKTIPPIEKYMTTVPQTIDGARSIQAAEEMMRRFDIRHIPVMKDEKVVGLISDRDISHYRGLVSEEDAKQALVQDACHSEAFAVSPDASLADVVTDMADRRIGSAVVVDHGHVVGIFTAVDAMAAFANILHQRFKA